jgi:hypothetical protein
VTPQVTALADAASEARSLLDTINAVAGVPSAGGASTETISKRLVRFVDDVRFTVNSEVLSKRAKPEELVALYQTTIKDFIDKLKGAVDNLKSKAKVLGAVQSAQKESAIYAVADQRVSATRVGEIFGAIEIAIHQLEQAIIDAEQSLPDEATLSQCISNIAK